MADVTGVNGVSSATSADPSSRVPIQTLGQNDFLKLLVAQLSSQDPLNPQKDTEFISQMAQFSALENSKSLETEMQSMRANQLLGQTVQVKLDEDRSTAGVVSAVTSQNGSPQIIVNGVPFSLDSIIRVQTAAVTATKIPGYAT